jgi:hydroxymethylglutaryl-CoA lyase
VNTPEVMTGCAPWFGAGESIEVYEVAPRDGLQSEPGWVDTSTKVKLINHLSVIGFKKIEVTAFVSPKAIPALADAREVMQLIERRAGVTYSALVPNLKGALAAIEAGVDELNLVMSASQSHNRANLRMSCDESFAQLREVAQIGYTAGVAVNVSLSCSFGCPFEGEVTQGAVLRFCDDFLSTATVNGITLCDTTGMAYPSQVYGVTERFRARWPEARLTLHFHDTRAMALANVIAAVDAGARRFDAALGGVGGCPYAPGASGNLCTESLVHALQWMGYHTGISLPELVRAAGDWQAVLKRPLPSPILIAGVREGALGLG